MKKRLAVLLGVLALSSFSFAAPTSVESSLNNLEAQLQKLEQMENKKFEERNIFYMLIMRKKRSRS